ncbi:bifunctional UDP-sugar hydrolase/5'-nucleotidase [Bacillus sp. JCM 19034]|uniref:bifunctional metallophosphatase/5'-nucleotidase n=1 Tax=Bacillus sp. JCM 19034 TaxID=1481928 RepID=UPI000781DC7D|nr:5'-nucleotidase C-terminal domain-containing protein [Bacillus sp. JCM 19034]
MAKLRCFLASILILQIVLYPLFFFEQQALAEGDEETSTQEREGTFELTVMHTNDTHAHLDRVAHRITAVRSIREEVEHSLLLDAGDVFSGTLFFNQYLGQADLEFMNMAEYDAMVPGNHEFDKGPEVFADFIKKAQFPFVSSNINYSQEPSFSDLFIDVIGAPAENGKVYPAIVKEFDGERVGIIGLTTEDTVFVANPGDHIVFENYLEKAKETVKRLEEEGVNKIIALTHLGYRYDRTLAEEVEGIDIVVGGHSHTLLDKPVVFHENTKPTLVVQANEYGEFLGRLDVTFDENGVLQSWDGQLIKVDEQDENGQYVYEEDPAATARLAELQLPIEELKKHVVGHTSIFLDAEREHIRSQETNLGNLIADGMLEKAQESVDAQIALQNAGGIRASIAEGDITLGDVLTVLPFGNTLVTLELTGEEIVEALELSVSSIDDGHGRFLQVAGLRFYFDRNEPAFERVFHVEVKTEDGYELFSSIKRISSQRMHLLLMAVMAIQCLGKQKMKVE